MYYKLFESALYLIITLGPIVTATASASMSTPWSIGRRDSAPKRTSLAYERELWVTAHDKLTADFATWRILMPTDIALDR